ncbi:HNH endonuclease signature motif containing protein [Arthrobacter sp. FW306-2-2C-D06B]|uniref:HNH endonuclease signature motif containing protein n=1 Tax=Arthrobacter sp. FW306-2-2C-D06B TaxID=2879618 RepID=UPI001F2F5DE6|nr:HNH endonuclease signature motif containing protein [Arthrobacter sp. FW306-2-2C-D06B]UKA57178.1 HNH endonuclease [Arthrobacter sp. FW306-2-2C-D06B]
MDGRTAWAVDNGADSRAAVAAVAASVAALTGLAGGAGSSENTHPLHDSDPLRALADGCLDGLAEIARLEARTAALKAKLAADYARAARALTPPAASPQEATAHELSLIAEVACILTVSERTAGALLAASRSLTTGLPLTLAALQSGTISWQHARIIIEETDGLDPAAAAALEAHFLDPDAPNPARGCPAGDLVPSRFRATARTWRERHHPVSIEERHTAKSADRRVEYLPDRDGMAWLSAHLPADTAAGIWDRTTAAARALQGPAETRTLAQLRADLTATWLLTNTGGATPDGGVPGVVPDGGVEPDRAGRVPSPRAQVLVTVPVLSLIGATEEPAMLDGYGPIPPSMARRLIADGADSFHRVLTDPRDGAPLEIGRTSYRLTKAMRQWLRLRDGKCPFPGCNNHSLDNDADHLLAWADGGTTGITNLAQPCPKHHRLKHRTAWTPTPASKNHPPGWTSPSHRHYPSEHQDWEPPHWPHHIPITDTDAGTPPDQDLPGNPEPELPPDPFPDWYAFTAAHPWPDDDDKDADAPDWPVPVNDPFPECGAFHGT